MGASPHAVEATPHECPAPALMPPRLGHAGGGLHSPRADLDDEMDPKRELASTQQSCLPCPVCGGLALPHPSWTEIGEVGPEGALGSGCPRGLRFLPGGERVQGRGAH